MQLNRYLEEYVLEFSDPEDAIPVENFVGVSIVTDGLKFGRNQIIGLIATRSDEPDLSFCEFLEGGDASLTQQFSGITPSIYAALRRPPEEVIAEFMDFIDGDYILMHNAEGFGKKFMKGAVEAAGYKFSGINYIDTMLVYRALRSEWLMAPGANQDEITINSLNTMLNKVPSLSISESLPNVYYSLKEEESEEAYTGIPQCERNAFMVRDVWEALLDYEVVV